MRMKPEHDAIALMRREKAAKRKPATDALKKAQKKYGSTLKGKAQAMNNRIKQKCKDKEIEFDLDAGWFLEKLNGNCELTGLPFDLAKVNMSSGEGPRPNIPSIDKIDPAKGYTKDNCRMLLYCVNAFKQTMTDKQMLKIAEKIVGALILAK